MGTTVSLLGVVHPGTAVRRRQLLAVKPMHESFFELQYGYTIESINHAKLRMNYTELYTHPTHCPHFKLDRRKVRILANSVHLVAMAFARHAAVNWV